MRGCIVPQVLAPFESHNTLAVDAPAIGVLMHNPAPVQDVTCRWHARLFDAPFLNGRAPPALSIPASDPSLFEKQHDHRQFGDRAVGTTGLR